MKDLQDGICRSFLFAPKFAQFLVSIFCSSLVVGQLTDSRLRVAGSAEGITMWDSRFPLAENERVGLISGSLLFCELSLAKTNDVLSFYFFLKSSNRKKIMLFLKKNKKLL